MGYDNGDGGKLGGGLGNWIWTELDLAQAAHRGVPRLLGGSTNPDRERVT